MKTFSGALLLLAMAGAASADETFTATAEVKNAAGAVRTAAVTVSYTRLITAAEREAVVSALKSGGQPAAKKVLAGMKDIGFIEVPAKKIPVKFAFARAVGSGRMVTLVAAEALGALKTDLTNTKPKDGYDLALVLLVLDADGKGTGEFTPAAKIKIRDDGAFTTEDSTTETIWLKGVAKK
jgi:hypothetical protein